MIKAVYLSNNSDATYINIEYMKKYGDIECAVFDNSDEAIGYLEKNPESLVLFEDGMNGVELNDIYRRLRQSELGGAFVVITAEDNCNTISNMYRDGISAVLVKPFDYDAFSVVMDYYKEHINEVCKGKISSHFWAPLSRAFTRKDSDFAELILGALKKEDFSAGDIARKIKKPVFLVQQCLNELIISHDVISYIKSGDDGTVERIFSYTCKEQPASPRSNNPAQCLQDLPSQDD